MSVTSTEKNINVAVIGMLEQNPEIKGDPLRAEALEVLRTLGLPSQKNEEFKYTPLTRELEKNFSTSAYHTLPLPSDLGTLRLPSLDSSNIVFVNGKYRSDLSSPPRQAAVTVISLKDALKNKAFASEHFAKIAEFKNNAFAAWNTAGWNDGLFVHVPENTELEKPLFLHYINDGSGPDLIELNRNLIVCGKNSKATIIEKFDTLAANFHFINLVNEIVVEQNADLNLYSIQNDRSLKAHHSQYTYTHIYQSNFSRVNTYTFTLNGKLIRNNLHLSLDGEGIESHMYGLYLLSNDTLADNHTVVDHKKPNSYSNELYKGIMDGNSKGVFNGKVYVRPNAQKTNAFQANRNILLTDKAGVNTKPQLEIWADDVKCSHGCTIGQLDEEALFYLRTRGINKDTAQAMMLYAFAGEVIESVKHPVIKEYLDAIIGERLHKSF